MAERGVLVDHVTVHRWALKMLPVLAAVLRRRKLPVGKSWRVDETYVLEGGQWRYLYRAVDKLGQTVDFLLTARRDVAAARRQTVPDDQQRPLQMGAQRLEELDVLLLLDRAFVQAEQEVRSTQSGDDGEVGPVEVELNDRCAALGRPGAHPRGPLAQTGLQMAFLPPYSPDLNPVEFLWA